MKFVADAMLGSLARWLRLLGFDTLYVSDISDAELRKLALKEDRVILTRDSHFINTPGSLIIKSEPVEEQVAQVLKDMGLKAEARSRCASCNGELRDVGKDEVKDSVPPHVYYAHERFTACEGCGAVYWEGSHFGRLREKIIRMAGGAAR